MTTERPTIPSIDRVPEAPRVPCVLVGELENVLERPGDYVARAWSEEGGSESLAAWQGRALRELVRRHRSTAGSAPASVGPGAEPDEASTSDLPEVVYTNRAAWRRGPAGHYLRLGPDGRESVVALTLGQLAGLPGGVRVQPGPPSWGDEDALGRVTYEAFGADTVADRLRSPSGGREVNRGGPVQEVPLVSDATGEPDVRGELEAMRVVYLTLRQFNAGDRVRMMEWVDRRLEEEDDVRD